MSGYARLTLKTYDPGLVTTTSAPRQAGNLPVPTTSFVGRRQEIAEVRRRLSVTRLVTLTGVGGVGKTRLALEMATQARRAFSGGAWMVDLATITDGTLIAQTVIETFGLVNNSTTPAVDKVAEYLSRRQVLLVLDNCEHLLAEGATFVDRVLRSAPGVRILVTSRQNLGIGGEYTYTVPPLSVPDPDAVPPAGAAAQSDAISLLVERAGALRPEFAVTPENHAVAARLVSQLDGIPLAIELAASRLRSLSLEQVVERLTDRFALLTGGSRTALPRQQTLRALIDWSYTLCSEQEKLLWARLAVFTGGFDLVAAEGVCSDAELPAAAILDCLDGLVAQSIVLVEPAESGAGRMRFRLLETIREYGWEHLVAAGQEAALRSRHSAYYLRFAEQIMDNWCGPDQEAELARSRADHGNMRAAFDAFVADPDGAHDAVALAGALLPDWCCGGYLGEGRRWLDIALAIPAPPSAARARALWIAAKVSALQGDIPVVFERLDECDRISAELPAPVAAATATSWRASAALFSGDLASSARLFGEAVSALHDLGDRAGELVALFQLAITWSHLGDSERARATSARGFAICDEYGERWARSYLLWTLAFDTWLLQKDPKTAEAQIREALSIQLGFKDMISVGLMTELHSWIVASMEDYPRAAMLIGAARTVWHQIGTSLAAFGPPQVKHQVHCERRTRQALRDSVFQTAVNACSKLSVAEIIAKTLEVPVVEKAGKEQAGKEAVASLLTRREHEVADLVARGMSNRMIAATLVLSPRTVDGHVERIFTKLGFTSRAQVVAWVSEQRSG
jgi:predicted ATPase/DNA-binding NarL/FixJ family response regulator